MDALDDLGGQRANLDAEQGAEKHADGEGVEHVAVDGVLADGGEAGGEDDLQDVGADGGHGGHAEDVHEHGEGDEAAADAHDGGEHADEDAAAGHDPAGEAAAAGNEVLVEGDHRRDVEVLELEGKVGHAGVGGRLFGGLHFLAAGGLQEVKEGVEAKEAEQEGVDGADEDVGDQGAVVVQALVDEAADEGAGNGADEEGQRELHGHVAELLVDRGAHDGLGEDMEQVRANGQNAFDAGGHEGGRDDEAAARADAAGDEAGGQADGDGGQEDRGGVERRRVRGLAAEHFVGVVGLGAAHDENRHCQGQEEEQLFAVFQNGRGDLKIPLGVRPGA